MQLNLDEKSEMNDPRVNIKYLFLDMGGITWVKILRTILNFAIFVLFTFYRIIPKRRDKENTF